MLQALELPSGLTATVLLSKSMHIGALWNVLLCESVAPSQRGLRRRAPLCNAKCIGDKTAEGRLRMPSHMLMRCGANTTARVCRTVKVILSEGVLDPTEAHFILIRWFLDTVLYTPVGLTLQFVGYTTTHAELLLVDHSLIVSNFHSVLTFHSNHPGNKSGQSKWI